MRRGAGVWRLKGVVLNVSWAAPKVGVVLLNWNSGRLTTACIESLLAMDSKPWRIIVIDNGSSDGSPERIAAAFPAAGILRNEVNLGFAGGSNMGICELLSAGADYIWLLNNDTKVDRGCLAALLGAMETDRGIAAATGKILYSVPADMIWYAGGVLKYWGCTAVHRGARTRDMGQFDQAEDVGFISGCCALLRREAVDEVGLLDERFFAYSEDFDWCLRARQLKLRLRYVPQAVLWHEVSASVRKNTLTSSGGTASPLAHYLATRNQLFIIRKHRESVAQAAAALLQLSGRVLYTSIGLLVLRRWDKLGSLWRGVWHGLWRNL